MTTPEPTPQRAERRLLALLCLTLALLQMLDLHSSLRAAGNGRAETNPAILWAMSHIGFMPAVLVFKGAALAITGGYHVVASGFDRMLWPNLALIPVCATYVAIVLNNYS